MNKTFKILLLIVLTAVSLAAAVSAWLFWTSAGARTIFGVVSLLPGIDIEAGEVRGRIADELRLEDAVAVWPGGKVRIDALHLNWRPFRLFARHLDVEELALSGVDVHLAERGAPKPEQPPSEADLTFPEVEGFLARAQAQIAALRAEDLAIRRGDAELAVIDFLEGSLSWRETVFTLESLSVRSPMGRLEAEGRVDFASPALRLKAEAEPAQAPAGMDAFVLHIDLTPAAGPRRLNGPIRFLARSAGKERLRLEGGVDWTRERLLVDDLTLRRPAQPGEGSGRVEIVADGEWRFDLLLRVAELDLSEEIGTPTDLTGRLQVSGTPEAYEGMISLANRVPGPQGGRFFSPFSGTARRVDLPSLEGHWLNGTIRGRLSALWGEETRVEAELAGEGLDPAHITPDWPGRIAFDLRGALRAGGEAPLTAEVAGRLRQSVLRGQALTGEVDARLRGEDLRIANLLLQGDGFDIRAQGELRERIDFRAQVQRLGALVPGARGSLQAQGWARWREGVLAGDVAATGRDIAAARSRVERLEVSAFHREGDGSLSVSAEAAGIVFEDLRVPSAALQARGSVKNHTLSVETTGPDLPLKIAARGGYAEGEWSGTLTDLQTGGARLGKWTLVKPADLRLSQERFALSPLRLTGLEEEFVQIQGALALSPRLGTLRGEWGSLDLSRADPWIPDAALAGRSTGFAQVEWLPNDRLDLRGRVEAIGDFEREGRRLELREGLAEIIWSPGGLQARWDLDLTGLGTAGGQFSSPDPAALAFPARGEGEALWQLPDLAGISPWLPGLELEGSSSGAVEGRWERQRPVEVGGSADFSGSIGYEELRLTILSAKAELFWDARGLEAALDLDMDEQGRANARFLSPEPIRAGLPPRGDLQAHLEELDLGLLAAWLPEEVEVGGGISGDMHAEWIEDEHLDLNIALALSGRMVREELELEVRRAEADLRWNGQGLLGRWDIALAPEGRVAGEVRSSEPARPQAPETGSFRGEWEDLALVRLRPWLPTGFLLDGAVQGEVEGEWLPEGRLRMTGRTEVRDGEMLWQGDAGIVVAALRQTHLVWDWRDESLGGEVSLALEEFGRADGQFRIPLPARLPVAIDPAGAVEGRLSAAFQEEGLMNAVFPGLVQETRGAVSLDVRLSGTWEEPDLGGEARLADAGAYLPAAGIRLQDVGLQAEFSGEEIRIVSLGARSGPGRIEGEGVVRLEDFGLQGYRLQIRGKDFQVVDLPELRVQSSPDLSIDGAPGRVAVRGEILIPYMLIAGRPAPAPVQPSPDVIVMDAPEEVPREIPTELDVQVRIVLGDHALIRAEGVDARYEGDLRVSVRGVNPEDITARGVIRVVQGRYSAFGVTLDIERGNVLFAGVPIDRPTLDILAIRTIDRPIADGGAVLGEEIREVRAGVLVTGTPREPNVVLYSEPAMQDADVLAYIVLGHPLGQGEGNLDVLMFAAGTLLSRGESAVLQDRFRRMLGVDVFRLEAGNGDIAASRITIGKYLSPSLYVSLGQSLFENRQEVRLRYDISRRWQLESKVAEESAVDLYYKIEFR